MALKTKLKKIMRMPPGEIAYRLNEQLRIRGEKKNAEDELRQVTSADFNFFENNEHFRLFRSGQLDELLGQADFFRPIAPVLSAIDARTFEKRFPQSFRKSLERADQLLENRFSFLGVSFTLPSPIPWQSDPLSLTPFPEGFYRNIDIFTNKNPGDIKHVWEVNRLQFLIELAKAYFISGEEKYKKHFDDLLIDWAAQNPYKRGVAWASALEVGVRAVALIWSLHFYRSCQNPDKEVLKTLVFQIYLALRYLDENLSIYFSPYNHLIGEAAGLFLGGYVFPGFIKGDSYAKKAWSILEDQAQQQFHADGGCVEQATFYHHFTLGFYLQSVITRRLNGDATPENVLKRIGQALRFAGHMTKPDGLLPYMGDIDNARSIYFSDPTTWDFKAFQALGAWLFKDETMKYVAGSAEMEELFWMLGGERLAEYEQIDVQEPENKSINLEESGYSIFRSGYGSDDHYLHIDCGPIAHGVFHDETPSAAHGHADELAVELAAFGESFLIDPGFANYRGDFERHCYFRSTAAHNTVEINGKSQAKQGGILVWSKAPRFKRLEFFDGKNIKGFVGEHYGYMTEPGSPVHRRFTAAIDQKLFIVWDHIMGTDATADVNVYWHFNDTIALRRQDGFWLATGNKARLKMFTLTSRQITSELFKGGDAIDEGWISPLYRDVKPAPLLRQACKEKLPLDICTILLPEKIGDDLKTGLDGNTFNAKADKTDYAIIRKDGVLEIRINGEKTGQLNNKSEKDDHKDWFMETE